MLMFHLSSKSFTSIALEDLFEGTSTMQLSQPTSDTHDAPIYMPLKLGDYNQNGFPDILLLLVNSTAKPASGGLFGGARGQGVQVKLLESKSCGKKMKACENKVTAKRRTFEVVHGKGMQALEEIWDARSVSWLDIDEDVSVCMTVLPAVRFTKGRAFRFQGSLDIMVQRTGVQTESRLTVLQNNFFHDAFFLKTLGGRWRSHPLA
jgi:integrin alpha FG-GAP repeat containing protein 1